MSPYFTDYLHYTRQLLDGSRASGERSLAEYRQRDITPYLQGDGHLRILDVANGRLRPQYTILKAAGHQVYGIDLVNRPQLSWVDMGYRIARWLYTTKLGLPSGDGAQTLVCGDVGALPFPDNSLDLGISMAAFEHFLDVPQVVAELYRVIRPGGLVWVGIHLFTCPSGGHNLSFTGIPLRTIPARVDPWDHLRQRRLPFHVPLNEWRRDQYLEMFARHFHILKHYCAVREGEGLLTPTLEAELSAYDRDELTCVAYIILARKEP